MRAKGIEGKLLAAVDAPIGIDINAETPEEIALSIVSELVKARGYGCTLHLDMVSANP
jgi:xanthine dehydrogenase accessory factor